MLRLIAVLFLMFTALSAVADAPLSCKYDNMSLMWNGRTRVEWGRLEYLCVCPAQHGYWLDKADCSR